VDYASYSDYRSKGELQVAVIIKPGAVVFAIGELARQIGVNIETIRYYERLNFSHAR
jgi:hypothetical protein